MDEMSTDFLKNGKLICSQCGKPMFEEGSVFLSDNTKNSSPTVLPQSLVMKQAELFCAYCGQLLGFVLDDEKLLGDSSSDAKNGWTLLSQLFNSKNTDKN